MIKIWLSSIPDVYTKYHFDRIESCYNFLNNLDYTIRGVHFLGQDNGQSFIWDFDTRMDVIYFVNFMVKHRVK